MSAGFGFGKTSNAVIGVKGEPPVAMVKSDDAEMNAAHGKARSTIGHFWTALDDQQPGEKNFVLKVRFPVKGHGDSGEHIWVKDVRRSADGTYSARLDNKPKFLPQYQSGDMVTFSVDMISDWMFTRHGKIVGNESMRPLLARMPKEKADQFRAMLEKIPD
ncbi:MAG: YegJ family protein [Hyphomicrobium sp.]